MSAVDRIRRVRKLTLLAGDMLAFTVVLCLGLYIRNPTLLRPEVFGFFTPVLVFGLASSYASGLYELRLVREFVALVGGLLASAVACLALSTVYFYLLTPYFQFAPRLTLIGIVIGWNICILGWRRLVVVALGFSLIKRGVVLLANDEYRWAFRESARERFGEEFLFASRVRDPGVNLVVVDRRWTQRYPEEARSALAKAISDRIPIVTIDDFYESVFGKVAFQSANDLDWALDHVLPRTGSSYFAVKRYIDVAVATLLGIALLPLMTLVAALVWLVDRESPMFGQARIGHLGNEFVLWKFRTMHLHADKAGPFLNHSAASDPRITRLGQVLRYLRLDELPQIWNVIKGDMSLVGPRPEWIREVEVLEKAVPTYRLRYLVLPGITGWAQVYFRATSNPLDSIEKHTFDLYYLKHCSLSLDFSIMLKTLKRVFVSDARVSATHVQHPSSELVETSADLRIESIISRS